MNKIIDFWENTGKKKYVFFDFFDTIVHRKCSGEDIKRKWAKELSNKLDNIDALLIYDMRREIEKNLYRISEEITYDDMCQELYKRLTWIKDSYIAMKSKEDFVQECLQIEISIEMDNQYIDKETEDTIIQLQKQNVHICIVSDFYLSKEAFVKFIAKYEIAHCFYGIFCSSDYKLRKDTGHLYDEVLEELHIGPNDCIMVGDNKISDYKKPRQKGIRAFQKKWYDENIDYSYMNIMNLLKRLRKKNKNGYVNYIFAYYYFIENLYIELKKKKQKNIFFLAREGELLKSYFDYYLEIKGDTSIRTHYIYSSRLASLIPSLKKIDDEEFYGIFGQFTDISIETFLKNLNFTTQEIADVVKEILNSDQIIIDFNHSNELINLKQNPVFRRIYETKRKEQKELFIEYLNDFGVEFKKEGMVLVDIGWKGTIQDNLYEMFEHEVAIQGYYLGLTGLARIEANNQKKGILFSRYPIENMFFETWNYDQIMYEKMLIASHGSTSYYKKENGVVVPEIKENKSETELYKIMADDRKQMMDIFKRLSDIFQESCYQSKDYLCFFLKTHIYTAFNLTRRKIKIHRNMDKSVMENFGDFNKKVQKSLWKKLKSTSIRELLCKDNYWYIFNMLDRFHLRWITIIISKVLTWIELKRVKRFFKNEKNKELCV